MDEAGKKQLVAVETVLLEKFTDLAFDEAAEMRWRESQSAQADNMDVGPLVETDLQRDLLEDSDVPF